MAGADDDGGGGAEWAPNWGRTIAASESLRPASQPRRARRPARRQANKAARKRPLTIGGARNCAARERPTMRSFFTSRAQVGPPEGARATVLQQTNFRPAPEGRDIIGRSRSGAVVARWPTLFLSHSAWLALVRRLVHVKRNTNHYVASIASWPADRIHIELIFCAFETAERKRRRRRAACAVPAPFAASAGPPGGRAGAAAGERASISRMAGWPQWKH